MFSKGRSHAFVTLILPPGLAIAVFSGTPSGAAVQAERGPKPASTETMEPLVVAGFRSAETTDARDAWIPTAVEETLVWRLRRVPRLQVIPAVRTNQAREELAESADDPPVEWSRVVPLLGAKLWLKGTCTGTPTALTLDLELVRPIQTEREPERVRIGPLRLFEVIDEATGWTLTRLRATRIDKTTERLVFAAPASSPTALEYYAKGIAAARAGNLRDGAYYAAQALDYDRRFGPALMLLTKIELTSPAPIRARADGHLLQYEVLSTASHDTVGQAELALAQGQALLMKGRFADGRERFESALAVAAERGEVFGQFTAMSSLCESWLNDRPPARDGDTPETIRQRRSESLRRAAKWQLRALELVREFGDVVAEAPATNKLALIYEELDQPDRALEWHRQTVAAAKKTGSSRSEATGWLFLGQWYRQQQRWEEALQATRRCFDLVNPRAEPKIHARLAQIYRDMSRPIDALRHYQAACEALAVGEDLPLQFTCLRAIAELSMELGQRETAIAKLREALDIAEVKQWAEQAAIRDQLARWSQETP